MLVKSLIHLLDVLTKFIVPHTNSSSKDLQIRDAAATAKSRIGVPRVL